MTQAERQAEEYASKATNNPHDAEIAKSAFYAGYFAHLNNWLKRK